MDRIVSIAAACMIAGSSACGAQQIAENATPGAIEGLSHPRSERAIEDVLASPHVREAIRDLSESVIDGSLNSLTAPRREQRIDALTERLVTSVGRAVGGGRDGRGVNPAIERAVTRTLSTALDGVMTEMEGDRARLAVRGLVRSAIEELILDAQTGIGPAAGDALTAALDEDTNRAVARTARVVARESARGAEEAVVDGPLVARITGPIDELTTIGWIFVALFIVALVGAGVVALAAFHRQHVESRRHEALAMLIASALVPDDRSLLTRRTLEALVKRSTEKEGVIYLREMLRTRAARDDAPDVREREPAPAE